MADDDPDRQGWTFTLRRSHLVVVGIVLVVAVAAFVLGADLHGGSAPAAGHASSATTTTAPAAHVPPVTTSPPSATAPTTTATPTTTAPATPTTIATAPLPVFTVTGYSGGEPVQIDFAPTCCDDTDNLVWSTWTATEAVGSGTNEYDLCTNSCANGPFEPYPATITLSDPVGGVFTTLTQVVASGPAAGTTTWHDPGQWVYGAR